MTRVRLCFHDRCFDGTASAALFYRLYRERFDANAEFGFTGMTHKAKQPWEPGLFDGDENAIVDFKYSNSPKLTWWFDHHQSAFLTPEDAEHFRTTSGPAHVLRAGLQVVHEADRDGGREKSSDSTRSRWRT